MALHEKSVLRMKYTSPSTEAEGGRKGELLQDGVFDTFDDAFTEIFNYIECYYNSKRRHSALGYLFPDKFEELYFSNLTVCP